MPQYMLDTNICTYVTTKRPPKLKEKFDAIADQMCISSITLAQLHFGAENSAKPLQNLQALAQFAGRLEILSFGPKAAVHYGQIRAALVRAGKPIGPHDLLISAHARSEGLIMVTNNLREFKRVPGLSVENWV